MIHVIGNAAVDSVIRVDRLPLPGETIVALGASEDLGGKGANQAIAAARCGADVRLVAAIGADALGGRIRLSLASEGVLTDGLSTSSYGTDRCVITVDDRGENTILSLIDAARHFDPIADTSVERWIRPGDWVVMQGNLRPNVTRDCLALAKSKGATTALNPSPTYAAHDYDWTLVDLLIVNRSEAIDLVGGEPEEPARALCKKGAGAVAVTLGADGGAFFSANDAFRMVPPRVSAVDAVGAGDVFCGVLIATKVLGREWREALTVATEAASASVTRKGVLGSFPSQEEMAGILGRAALGRLETELAMTEDEHAVARARENALKSIFGRTDRVLIGVVHLLPLPASPDYSGGGVEAIYARALADARAYADAGFDGLIVENHGDIPFSKPEDIGPETAAHMAIAVDRARGETGLPLGVNVLANAALHALAVASAAGARFVRVNQWANAYVANEGLIEGAAAKAMRYRSALQAHGVNIFADAHVKHGAHAIVQDRPIAELVRDVEFFNADVVIFTGQRTGHAADFDYLRKIRAAASLPTLVGSGVDPGNVGDILSIVEGVIVASSLKVDGRWWNPVDRERAKQFVDRARKAS